MKVRTLLAVVVICAVLSVFCGCEQQAAKQSVKITGLSLVLSPGTATVYKTSTTTGKYYDFDQPSVNKKTTKETQGQMGLTYEQKIVDVDQQGNATALITIRELKYASENSQGVVASDYDSAEDPERRKPLSKLLDMSYTIKIAPNGVASLVDANEIANVIKGGEAKKIVNVLTNPKEVVKRHSVAALLDAGKAKKAGDTWSTVVPSPAGMLESKAYEKVYTLESLNKNEAGQTVATITMKALPSSTKPADMPADSGGMGFFAKMFDSKDDYTGTAVVNLTTGEVISANENLNAEWVAAENPNEQKSDRGPDVLTMRFKHIYNIEKVQQK